MKTLAELQSLKGRVALITGGAGHLGRTFGEVAAEMGASIILVDRDPNVSKVAKDLAERFGVRSEGVTVDLTDRKAVSELPTAVVSSFGRLDILVNNAAFTGDSNLAGWSVPFPEQSCEAWSAAMEVNLMVPFLLSQKAAPFLAENQVGTVVNVASIYGVVGPDFRLYEGTKMNCPAAYSASKGGIIQLTRYLATALAPGIRVNSITPGGIQRGQPASFSERYVARVPLARMGVEEDFKGISLLLFSDMGAYITGQNFVVDGGLTIW